MHKKFGLSHDGDPAHLDLTEKEFRVKAMQEELDEYKEAVGLVDEYDALLDLLVFTVGTLERHGFPLLEGFETVMRANMKKELAASAEASKRGFKRDLVKPAGWTGPEEELNKILFDVMEKRITKLTGTKVAPSSDGTIVPGFAPKFDSDKVRVDLLPIGPMMQIANVFGFGTRKYFANSYREGDTVAWSRTYGSILRHLFDFWRGVDKDPESNHHHLAHAGTQLLILMEHVEHNKDKDDRFVR
jgi:hypothetical protein